MLPVGLGFELPTLQWGDYGSPPHPPRPDEGQDRTQPLRNRQWRSHVSYPSRLATVIVELERSTFSIYAIELVSRAMPSPTYLVKPHYVWWLNSLGAFHLQGHRLFQAKAAQDAEIHRHLPEFLKQYKTK